MMYANDLIHFNYRTRITNILYAVSLNDLPTFPINDPPPSTDDIATIIQDVLPNITPYTGPTYRVDQLFSVMIEGNATSTQVRTEMELAISGAWRSTIGRFFLVW